MYPNDDIIIIKHGQKQDSPLGFEPAILGHADAHPNHYTTAAADGGAESRLGPGGGGGTS